MTNKYESLNQDEITLDKEGNLEISDEIKDLVSGGVNPEDTEEEINISCKIMNDGCGRNIIAS